jgi:heptaprenyl diphosphate synthase
MNLLNIYMRKKKDIQFIEQQIEQTIAVDLPTLHQSALHLVKAGGKRIRPVFVLLAGEFGEYDLQKLQHIAVPLELIHMATLVHDDVIDDADLRRGQPTVKSKWDNKIAMFTGDYIFSKALLEATRLENPKIHQVLSNAIVQMCLGEMEQIRLFFQIDQSLRDYLLRIKRKTALLLAISCQLGAMAVDAKKEYVRALYDFGYNAGMAFQITDDLLDLMGSEAEIGKPPGSDLRQGNITLPYLLAMHDPKDKDFVRSTLLKLKDNMDPHLLVELIERMRQHQAIDQTKKIARRYIDKALDALGQLPDMKARDDLKKISMFIQERSY